MQGKFVSMCFEKMSCYVFSSQKLLLGWLRMDQSLLPWTPSPCRSAFQESSTKAITESTHCDTHQTIATSIKITLFCLLYCSSTERVCLTLWRFSATPGWLTMPCWWWDMENVRVFHLLYLPILRSCDANVGKIDHFCDLSALCE